MNHHVNYILNNPVKHGYVKHPEEWPYTGVGRASQSEPRQGLKPPKPATSP